MNAPHNPDIDPQETQEWLESLDSVVDRNGPARAQYLLKKLLERSHQRGASAPFQANTPYVNTIPVEAEPPYPGNRDIERRIKSIIRWNAMAMVVRSNRQSEGIGGHLSTYASAATLYEVGFNHYFRGKTEDSAGDQIYIQGHASPGVYARALLEGRISEEQVHNFRRELAPGGGLSSYPHPWLMPDFWQFPTVSMGLGPLSAIYQARFNNYLLDRGICDTSKSRVWAFLGDGEMDEPESMGSITLASREQLDNLTFVVNCNLQRLDGPVRGNGKIIQELEAAFRGAGWNVIKLIWGSGWDPLFERDTHGIMAKTMGEIVDGEYQKYSVEDGAYVRENFFGKHPDMLRLVDDYSDDMIWQLRRGGHDPVKVNAAFNAAVNHKGSPTIILAKTIKGYGLGEAGEGRNITHQQKKLNLEELREFRDRFEIPISDEQLQDPPLYVPPPESEERQYIRDRREAIGGFVPARSPSTASLTTPEIDIFAEFLKGSGDREASTTMVFVRMLARLLDDPEIGKLIVPIVPDEARTFGMDALFRKYGIYAHTGQLYEPVDSHLLLYYREAKDGQILEEGITEAGSMASFTAAGSAYATHGAHTIPFFMYYSMFGFQRIGDSVWAAADLRCRGFLIGCTAGRTTLAGEGLQHQDGQSHLIAATVPNCIAYDPAFAYEIAVIVQEGLRRMYRENEDVFYYITLENETYAQTPMIEGCEEGILRGLYLFKPTAANERATVQLFGSGPILNETIHAQSILADEFGIHANVWSATSYNELKRNAMDVERHNRRNPQATPQRSWLDQQLDGYEGPIIAASDYVRNVPDQVAPWLDGRLTSLGTDGFGRSEARKELRAFFEVDRWSIAYTAIHALVERGELKSKLLDKAAQICQIDPKKPNPRLV